MSTFRNPVGPQPPSVYWRRRLVVGLLLAVVVAVVLLIVFRPGTEGGTQPDEAETPGPGTSQTPEPGGSVTPGEAAECSPSAVRLIPVVSGTTIPNGEEPMLSMEITNIGAASCSFDVGTGAQEYLITSGSDRIWSSRDCQTEPTENVTVLEPDVTYTTEPFAWDRTRSSTSTCTGNRPEVIAGGASYHLAVLLGEAESEGTFQFILN